VKIKSELFNDIYMAKDYINNKIQANVLFLRCDDFYFEEIDKKKIISREIITTAKRISKEQNIDTIKIITFFSDEDIKTRLLYEFIGKLKEDNHIIAVVYNRKLKECNILLLCKEDNTIVEEKICDFLLECEVD